MTRNDAEDFAQRLYGNIPAHYRAYDAEQGLPLLALMRVVGEQAAHLRQDLEALWDNFFIETCEDWAVPYLAALVGTNLLARPVGQSGRLDVRNTVRWRRSKGAPAMLADLAADISGWPTELAELFQGLAWSQHLNHLRLDRPLTAGLRDPYALSRLGRADDRLAHAADLRPARPLDGPRVTPDSLGVGRAAWGTPGRHQIRALGLHARRLQTFAVSGATPAAGPPGPPPPEGAAVFTFDPLFREAPLFVAATGAPLDRAAFGREPWRYLGADLSVRQHGVPLVSEEPPAPQPGASRAPFAFGGAGAGLALDPARGMELLEAHASQGGAAHFALAALWRGEGAETELGALSTLRAALGEPDAFRAGAAAPGPGRLAITLRLGRNGLGWPDTPPSPPARFPGAVLAVRAAREGPLRDGDALYVYLPAAPVRAGETLTFFVADDGATYSAEGLAASALARPSEGQVYPPRPLSASVEPAPAAGALGRGPGAMRLADPGRYGGAGALLQAELFSGAFQPLGALATVTQTGARTTYPDLEVPSRWPALTYGPSKAALADDLPEQGPLFLAVLIRPLAGATDLPPAELALTSRAGRSLLVYLPGLRGAPAEGVRVLVAADGSTYFAPGDGAGQLQLLRQGSLGGLPLARAAAGQTLPIPGEWPLRQRRAVALDLCRPERAALLRPGELGVDPERGRFALAPGDPAIGAGALGVSYTEAFAERVGARTFDRRLEREPPATRLVAASGDARPPGPAVPRERIHATLAEALAAAGPGEVIEIVDSATYLAAGPVVVDRAGLGSLTVRAAEGQRPCLAFYGPDGAPAAAALRVAAPLDSLALGGLLISGGPLLVEAPVGRLELTGCTLDPLGAGAALVATADAPAGGPARYLLCRCISGALRLGPAVEHLLVADSVVDRQGGLAIGGPPAEEGAPDPPAQTVQLERATVLGRVRCDVLHASETLLDELAAVDDQQAGSLRFCRYELGSTLPRRYQCLPTDAQAAATPPGARCMPPRLSARRFGRPDYAQLAAAAPPELLAASEGEAEIGAFASARATTRLANQAAKLREFLPAGLEAIVIGET